MKKHIIGSRGHAKSYNTIENYYSEEVERFLSESVETPLGILLRQIDTLDLTAAALPVIPNLDTAVKDYIYALLCRSPDMLKKINDHSLLFPFCEEQSRHDYSVAIGIGITRERDLLKNHSVTLAINRTSIPLLLPISGGCSSSDESPGIPPFFPVSPVAAGMLIQKSVFNQLAGGRFPYILIEESEIVRKMNLNSVKEQYQRGYGTIISSERETLEETLQEAELPLDGWTK